MKKSLATTRPISSPYATFFVGSWEYRVLKTYQTPENEAKNKYARWFVAAKSPMTGGAFDIGDSYIADLLPVARFTQISYEFRQIYAAFIDTPAESSGAPAESGE
jgi:hypothetical protein